MEEGTINIQNIREHQQKTFNTLSRFWLGGGEGLSESFKKENLRQKSFFTECSSRDLWKMISADVKLIKTTKNKRVGGSIRQDECSKIELKYNKYQYKRGMYFSSDFGWYSNFDIVS